MLHNTREKLGGLNEEVDITLSTSLKIPGVATLGLGKTLNNKTIQTIKEKREQELLRKQQKIV